MPLVFLVLLLVAAADAAESPLEAADGAFRERATAARAREALDGYRALWEAEKRPELGWRLAMACQFVGMRLTKDRDEKLALFAEGREAAKDAARKDPDCGPCHFWAGINMALYGDTKGVLKMLFTLGTIREHLERAAALDPGHAHGGPYRILGTIDQKLPGILGGNDGRARERFEKAMAAAPGNPLNALFLAKLVEDKDGKEAGRAMARKVLPAVVPPAPADVESFEAWNELRKMAEPPADVS